MRLAITRKTLIIILLAGIFIAELLILFTNNTPGILSPEPSAQLLNQSVTPTPDTTFRTYVAPVLPNKTEYTIVMVGDSMTHALGPRGGTFSEFINERYKPLGKGIVIDNYASGSTNILSLKEAMTKETTYWDSTFPPLLSRKFDLILIESFGYNPLSDYSLEEGLQKQQQALQETMETLIKTHPESRIAFVATIAPDKETFALKINPNTTLADRILQVEERVAYIKNHLEYAEEHGIPVINIYEKSLTADGNGDTAYINPDDTIHPSFAGVDFIGRTLADTIFEQQLLPH